MLRSPRGLGLGLGLDIFFDICGLGLDMFFDTNSIRGSNSVDGVCDFESVPSDQLCPSAKTLSQG